MTGESLIPDSNVRCQYTTARTRYRPPGKCAHLAKYNANGLLVCGQHIKLVEKGGHTRTVIIPVIDHELAALEVAAKRAGFARPGDLLADLGRKYIKEH